MPNHLMFRHPLIWVEKYIGHPVSETHIHTARVLDLVSSFNHQLVSQWGPWEYYCSVFLDLTPITSGYANCVKLFVNLWRVIALNEWILMIGCSSKFHKCLSSRIYHFPFLTCLDKQPAKPERLSSTSQSPVTSHRMQNETHLEAI